MSTAEDVADQVPNNGNQMFGLLFIYSLPLKVAYIRAALLCLAQLSLSQLARLVSKLSCRRIEWEEIGASVKY